MREPDDRLGARDISDLLAHPVFKDIDFKKVFDIVPNLPARATKLSQ